MLDSVRTIFGQYVGPLFVPPVKEIYDSKDYDPLKGLRQKVTRPRGGQPLYFKANVRPISVLHIDPKFTYFNDPEYKDIYREFKSATIFNSGAINNLMDPLWRDFRPGRRLVWLSHPESDDWPIGQTNFTMYEKWRPSL